MKNVSLHVSMMFRILVALHLLSLYVLTFVMKTTVFGFWHVVVAAGLTFLMFSIVTLFVWDMATPQEMSSKSTKLIDGLLGAGWLCIVGFLVMNSLRSGIW